MNNIKSKFLLSSFIIMIIACLLCGCNNKDENINNIESDNNEESNYIFNKDNIKTSLSEDKLDIYNKICYINTYEYLINNFDTIKISYDHLYEEDNKTSSDKSSSDEDELSIVYFNNSDIYMTYYDAKYYLSENSLYGYTLSNEKMDFSENAQSTFNEYKRYLELLNPSDLVTNFEEDDSAYIITIEPNSDNDKEELNEIIETLKDEGINIEGKDLYIKLKIYISKDNYTINSVDSLICDRDNNNKIVLNIYHSTYEYNITIPNELIDLKNNFEK